MCESYMQHLLMGTVVHLETASDIVMSLVCESVALESFSVKEPVKY